MGANDHCIAPTRLPIMLRSNATGALLCDNFLQYLRVYPLDLASYSAIQGGRRSFAFYEQLIRDRTSVETHSPEGDGICFGSLRELFRSPELVGFRKFNF